MALISGMKTAAEYLEKTESATRKLFEGIDSYLEVIRRLAKYDVWVRENETDIAASLKAQRDFVAESFAHATLCEADKARMLKIKDGRNCASLLSVCLLCQDQKEVDDSAAIGAGGPAGETGRMGPCQARKHTARRRP